VLNFLSIVCCVGSAATGQVSTLLSRGQAAVQALRGAADESGRRAVDAFHQLSLLQQIMEAYDHQLWVDVLQVGVGREGGVSGL
jgi:hypothetical protein